MPLGPTKNYVFLVAIYGKIKRGGVLFYLFFLLFFGTANPVSPKFSMTHLPLYSCQLTFFPQHLCISNVWRKKSTEKLVINLIKKLVENSKTNFFQPLLRKVTRYVSCDIFQQHFRRSDSRRRPETFKLFVGCYDEIASSWTLVVMDFSGLSTEVHYNETSQYVLTAIYKQTRKSAWKKSPIHGELGYHMANKYGVRYGYFYSRCARCVTR